MKMHHAFLVGVALSVAFIANPGSSFGEEGWGDVTGQIVLDGKAPEPVVLIQKGDTSVKDAEVCAAVTHYKQDLVIDEETQGIANVFLYMRRAPTIHPELEESEEKQIVFDQKNCQFLPHALLVRTDQTVLVKSDDPLLHNTHTYPLRNPQMNFTLSANDRSGVEVDYNRPEILPIQVKCDVHPWMLAHWLILDHPYMAVTNEKGEFKIEKLPAGEHEFRVWHERVGYVEREFKITVASGESTKLDPLKVPADKFKE